MSDRDKTKQFNFRLLVEEYEAVTAIARRAGLSVASWLRQAIRHAAGLPLLDVAGELGLNESERRRVREIVRQWLASREAAEAGPRRRREVVRALGKLGRKR